MSLLRNLRRRVWLGGVAVVILAGLGVGVAVSASGSASAQPADPVTEIKRAADRLGADLYDIGGDHPAIQFAPGVTFGQALRDIYVAQTTGRASGAMAVTDSLPAGVVAVIPESASDGVIIDLNTPFGWDPRSGNAFSPTLRSPPGWGARDWVTPWPHGTTLAIPILPECMVMRARDEAPARQCSAGDVPFVDADSLPDEPLP